MRFWDASALVPMLIEEPVTGAIRSAMEADRELTVWWATPVECASAVARRLRECAVDPPDADEALRRLDDLAAHWQEVAPTDAVRRAARRLLRIHQLRAADALQLAAALIAAGDEPGSLPLVSLDERLIAAARLEGFAVVEI